MLKAHNTTFCKQKRPAVAVALFSAAVSLKMNVLLMAPPVLLVLLRVGAVQ